MTAYRYQALNTEGKLVRGVLEGDSERQVRGQLRGQSLRPVDVSLANAREATRHKAAHHLTSATNAFLASCSSI